jgi:predicted HicB family RNase H-like nuclease
MFTYKGYLGQVKVDEDSKMLCGRVIGIKAVITFKGETVEEAVQNFQDSVEDYLEYCAELGVEPDKPFSGRLPYRTTPDTHRKIFEAANKAGKSINSWMDEVLSSAAEQALHSRAYS